MWEIVGFLVTLGVVIDTFVIRNVLAPCMFVWMGDLNYWPHEMPAPTKALEMDHVTKASQMIARMNKV